MLETSTQSPLTQYPISFLALSVVTQGLMSAANSLFSAALTQRLSPYRDLTKPKTGLEGFENRDLTKAGLGALFVKSAYGLVCTSITSALIDRSCSISGLDQTPYSSTARLALLALSTAISTGVGLRIQSFFKANPLSKSFSRECVAGPAVYMLAYQFLVRPTVQPLITPPPPQESLTTRLFNQVSSVVTSGLTSGLLHTAATVGGLSLFESYTKQPESPSSGRGFFSKKQPPKASLASTLYAKSAVVGLSSFLSSLCISYAAKQAGEAALYGSVGGVALSTLLNLVLLSKKGNPLALGAATSLGTLAGLAMTVG